MKKIILVSMYVIASVVMSSCTNDGVETTPSNNKVNVVADAGGQETQPPLPPPKP
jgi:hypothetical protein